MLLKFNVIYSKILIKNKLCFVIEKIKQIFLNVRIKTFYNNIKVTKIQILNNLSYPKNMYVIQGKYILACIHWD
jgi:hypothetical protein